MKKGDIVKIYQKPFTDEDFEGEAKLIKKIGMAEDYGEFQIEDWMVEFERDKPSQFRRRIKIK